MQKFNQFCIAIRNRYLNSIKDYLDPGYYILTNKTNTLSTQEQEFIEVYANTVCLHSSNIILTFPGVFYYYHYFRASRKQPLDQMRLQWAKRRILFYMPLCFATMVTAYCYQKSNDFQGRLKQIQQFYMDHKGQNLNEISFKTQVLRVE